MSYTFDQELETRLRERRPTARPALVAAIRAADRTKPRRRANGSLLFASALTVTLAVALSAVGGVSYAANAVRHAAGSAKAIVVTHTHATPVVVRSISAGGDQYRPGFGFGDPNHNHTGPPGLSNGNGGQKAPPSQTSSAPDGKAKLAAAVVSVDEQAAIYISVLDSDGVQLLLTQKGTKIGGGAVTGPQVKTIHYVMLVPRVLSLKLRIPANLVLAGKRYSIRVIAVDAQGNKRQLLIPFTA